MHAGGLSVLTEKGGCGGTPEVEFCWPPRLLDVVWGLCDRGAWGLEKYERLWLVGCSSVCATAEFIVCTLNHGPLAEFIVKGAASVGTKA